MLERHARDLRSYMTRAFVAAGFSPGDIGYVQQGRYFTALGSGIEVAVGRADSSGRAWWILREVHDLADLQDGGARPVVAEIARYPIGQEMTAARAAAMAAVERRIDLALEETA